MLGCFVVQSTLYSINGMVKYVNKDCYVTLFKNALVQACVNFFYLLMP